MHGELEMAGTECQKNVDILEKFGLYNDSFGML